jgi:DNA mismatch endonuclease (patch repair protein)
MPDVFTKTKRSKVMSLIKGKGNKDTELRMIQLFRLNRINGWRRGCPLPGRPDFVFPKLKVAVFVDGCFWHGCSTHFKMPSNNKAFWETKIQANRKRDRIVNKLLKHKGWVVLRIWEHDLRQSSNLVIKHLQSLSAQLPSAGL